jgi:hypothetical protein
MSQLYNLETPTTQQNRINTKNVEFIDFLVFEFFFQIEINLIFGSKFDP